MSEFSTSLKARFSRAVGANEPWIISVIGAYESQEANSSRCVTVRPRVIQEVSGSDDSDLVHVPIRPTAFVPNATERDGQDVPNVAESQQNDHTRRRTRSSTRLLRQRERASSVDL